VASPRRSDLPDLELPVKKRRIKAPLLPHPDSAIREYYRNIKRYADKYNALVEYGLREMVPALRKVAKAEQPRLDSIRMDANIEKRISDLFEWVDRELTAAFPDSVKRQWAADMIKHTNRNSKSGMKKVFMKAEVDVEPLLHDRELNPFFQNVVDENVGLIKSIPTERETAFKNALVRGIGLDMPSDQIADIIRKHIGKNGNVAYRAKFIARDQVSKTNAALNKYRQQQLGGKAYFWRGSKDQRERHDHLILEGKRFTWDKPPVTNQRTKGRSHPGEDPGCRCRAEMDMSDVLI
jgi:SPP1 gp7 family putative phage head morphogenesis protein